MTKIKEIKEALTGLLFPHLCYGCGSNVLNKESCLCIRCINELPSTLYEWHAGNPVEKKFFGRLPLKNATAQYYFTRSSLISHLVHLIKYKGERELGVQLGQLMGNSLLQSGRFNADFMIPLPLFPSKERKRGYNQSYLLCKGIEKFLRLPIRNDIITRPHQTETQTKKGRIERWKNMEGKFVLKNNAAISGKHILLVDDVITTGATLESCGIELLRGEGVELSIACLCQASRI